MLDLLSDDEEEESVAPNRRLLTTSSSTSSTAEQTYNSFGVIAKFKLGRIDRTNIAPELDCFLADQIVKYLVESGSASSAASFSSAFSQARKGGSAFHADSKAGARALMDDFAAVLGRAGGAGATTAAPGVTSAPNNAFFSAVGLFDPRVRTNPQSSATSSTHATSGVRTAVSVDFSGERVTESDKFRVFRYYYNHEAVTHKNPFFPSDQVNTCFTKNCRGAFSDAIAVMKQTGTSLVPNYDGSLELQEGECSIQNLMERKSSSATPTSVNDAVFHYAPRKITFSSSSPTTAPTGAASSARTRRSAGDRQCCVLWGLVGRCVFANSCGDSFFPKTNYRFSEIQYVLEQSCGLQFSETVKRRRISQTLGFVFSRDPILNAVYFGAGQVAGVLEPGKMSQSQSLGSSVVPQSGNVITSVAAPSLVSAKTQIQLTDLEKGAEHPWALTSRGNGNVLGPRGAALKAAFLPGQGVADTERTLRIHTEFFSLTVFLLALLVVGLLRYAYVSSRTWEDTRRGRGLVCQIGVEWGLGVVDVRCMSRQRNSFLGG